MSLKAWYSFNNTYANQGCGDADLTVTTTPSYVSGGKIGNALSTGGFKWTASQTSKIFNNNEVSICFWIKPTVTATESAKYNNIIFGNDSGGRMFSIFQYPTCNDLHWSFYSYVDSSWVLKSSHVISGAFPSDVWTHLCIVYKNPNFYVYINGNLNYSCSFTYGADSFAFQSQVITSSAYRNINDVRVYDHALSVKEVKEISKGLVLHYKLDNSYVENTTNINNYISQGISDTCYNGAKSTYNYGTTTDMYKTTGTFQGKKCTKVYMGTAGASACPYIFFSPIHPTENSYKTLSFDYFPTIGSTITFYTYNGSATTQYRVNNGPVTSGRTIPVNTNKWNHIEFTLLGTSSSASGWGYMITTTHTSTLDNYWLFANVQIENKDHATPFTTSSRTNTRVYDCSGYSYNGTKSSTDISMDSDSARYSYSTKFPNSSYFVTPTINTSGFANTYTFSWWGKTTSIDGRMAWGFSNGNRLNLYPSTYFCWNTGDGNSNPFKNNGTGVPYSSYADGNWHFYTITGDGTTTKLYIDGTYKGSATTYKSLTGTQIYISGWDSGSSYKWPGSLSDFRIYSTALSADDILQLYKSSASIDKNGNLYAYELVEE